MFAANLPCKLKAEIDLKTIEAIMLTMQEKKFKKMQMKPDFPGKLAMEISRLFDKHVDYEKSAPV